MSQWHRLGRYEPASLAPSVLGKSLRVWRLWSSATGPARIPLAQLDPAWGKKVA